MAPTWQPVNKGFHLFRCLELIAFLKFWYLDFGMGFETAVHEESLFLGRDEGRVLKTALFATG